MKSVRVVLAVIALLALPFGSAAAQGRSSKPKPRATGSEVSDCKDQQAAALARAQADGHSPYGLDKKCDDPVPPNQPPVANFTFSCSGLACNFTSTSSDLDGSVASYAWTFGDGGTSTLASPSNTYAAAGSYSVSLTVTDNQGAHSSPISVTVTVTALPPPDEPPTGPHRAVGIVYEDIDGNGSRDKFAGEMGLAGWTVQLLWNGRVIRETQTDADGNYVFMNLGEGAQWSVCLVQQPGYNITEPGSACNPFTLPSNLIETYAERNYGEMATP